MRVVCSSHVSDDRISIAKGNGQTEAHITVYRGRDDSWSAALRLLAHVARDVIVEARKVRHGSTA